MRLTTSSAGPWSRPLPSTEPPKSAPTTFAPSWAMSRAMPRPMPRPAPVTIAVFPSSLLAISCLLGGALLLLLLLLALLENEVSAQDLPGRRLRDGLDELHLAQLLVGRHPLLDEAHELLGGRFRARA